MFEQQPTLELLFEQLGLEADDASIESFVKTHQLSADRKIAGDRSKDTELNQQLHVDSTK